MNATELEPWLTPSQAAFRLGVSAEAVRQYCNRGGLVVVRTGHGRLIDPASIERLAKERQEQWRRVRSVRRLTDREGAKER